MNKERDLLKQIHYCWICATDLDEENPEINELNEVMRKAEHYLFHEPEAEFVMLEEYDAGLLGDYGGGNVEWWQDYIRAELGRAHEYYQSQISAHPLRPEPATKLLPKKIDPILIKHSPNYVSGWNNCIDAIRDGAQAMKPMTEEEIKDAYANHISKHNGYSDYYSFFCAIRFAERHHFGIEDQ